MSVQIPEDSGNALWRRLPKQKQRLEGLSRTTVLEQVYRGNIKSAVIRKGKAKRGIRVIYMPSLYKFLESCIESKGP
jgi:hypothetical protein